MEYPNDISSLEKHQYPFPNPPSQAQPTLPNLLAADELAFLKK
jgi:hypothetical protein